jgi:hypothetical protein
MLRLKTERDDVAAALSAETEARTSQQRQHDALIEQWRHALEIREKDMEDLQECLNPPRDLELLRVQASCRCDARCIKYAITRTSTVGFRSLRN